MSAEEMRPTTGANKTNLRRLRLFITWIVLPFLLLALVAALPAEWIRSRTTEPTGPLVVRAESDDGDKSAVVLASVPRDLVNDDRPLPLTLTLTNQSAT
ncbi:MAG TPA: hypothetical protein VF266_03360, partial [Thermoanaerobaculia bacterium]